MTVKRGQLREAGRDAARPLEGEAGRGNDQEKGRIEIRKKAKRKEGGKEVKEKRGRVSGVLTKGTFQRGSCICGP